MGNQTTPQGNDEHSDGKTNEQDQSLADGSQKETEGQSEDKEAPAADAGATSGEEAEEKAPPPKPRPKAKWLVKEPEDQSDAVPHVLKEATDRDDSWALAAASVRGKLHAHRALWREDSYCFDWLGPWTILAVADGAGSASLSRIGSRLACKQSVATLKASLESFDLESLDFDSNDEEWDHAGLSDFLADAASAARKDLEREAEERERSLKDFSTTLLLVIHCEWRQRHLVGCIQVGDGSIGIYQGNGKCTILGEADHGEYSSQTVFLTSDLEDKPLDRRTRFELADEIECIGVMSDGVSDDFFPEKTHLVELFENAPIQGIKSREGDPVRGALPFLREGDDAAEELAKWIRYEKRASSDDRTLLLLYRKREPAVAPSAPRRFTKRWM